MTVSELNTKLQPHACAKKRQTDFSCRHASRQAKSAQMKAMLLSGKSGQQASFNVHASSSFGALQVDRVVFCVCESTPASIFDFPWRFFVVNKEDYSSAPLFEEGRMQVSLKKWLDLYQKYEVSPRHLAAALVG